MDFLNHLVRKSDISQYQTEYFNYKPSARRPRRTKTEDSKPEYQSLNQSPLVSDYVVFDLETTGLNGNINAIVEIGAVKVKDNRLSDSFSALINPEQYIPAYLVDKIHITNSMVQDKPTIDTVLPCFIDFIEELPLVAHNASFDMSFLLKNCIRQNIIINNPVIDTLYLSRHYLKECKRHNLGYLTSYFNVELKKAHRAYYDARATQQIFEIIKEHIIAENGN